MKKSAVLLVSILFVSILSFSQSTSIGFFGGTNLSAVNGSYFAWGHQSTQMKNRTGMQMGFIFDYPITESLGLYADPAYIQKGFKYESEQTTGGPGFTGENKFQYIQLPLSLKLSLFKNKVFYVRSGLYLSFLLDAHLNDEYSYNNSGNLVTTYTNEKIKNDLNASTMGFVMGTGADIPLSSKLQLLIDVAYQMDMSNAMKDNPPVYPWGFKSSVYNAIGSVRNHSLSLSVGLALGI